MTPNDTHRKFFDNVSEMTPFPMATGNLLMYKVLNVSCMQLILSHGEATTIVSCIELNVRISVAYVR